SSALDSADALRSSLAPRISVARLAPSPSAPWCARNRPLSSDGTRRGRRLKIVSNDSVFAATVGVLAAATAALDFGAVASLIVAVVVAVAAGALVALALTASSTGDGARDDAPLADALLLLLPACTALGGACTLSVDAEMGGSAGDAP